MQLWKHHDYWFLFRGLSTQEYFGAIFTLQFPNEHFPWSFYHSQDISNQHQVEIKGHKRNSHNQCRCTSQVCPTEKTKLPQQYYDYQMNSLDGNNLYKILFDKDYTMHDIKGHFLRRALYSVTVSHCVITGADFLGGEHPPNCFCSPSVHDVLHSAVVRQDDQMIQCYTAITMCCSVTGCYKSTLFQNFATWCYTVLP